MIERERCTAERMHRANEVDQRMAALVKQKNRVMAEMIPLVHEIECDRLFSALGETSVTNYMRKRACWEKSKTEKVVALARKIEHLPHLREALHAATSRGRRRTWPPSRQLRRRTRSGPTRHSR